MELYCLQLKWTCKLGKSISKNTVFYRYYTNGLAFDIHYLCYYRIILRAIAFIIANSFVRASFVVLSS